jgi:hypothetical protein
VLLGDELVDQVAKLGVRERLQIRERFHWGPPRQSERPCKVNQPRHHPSTST